jgi:hypothetical protein
MYPQYNNTNHRTFSIHTIEQTSSLYKLNTQYYHYIEEEKRQSRRSRRIGGEKGKEREREKGMCYTKKINISINYWT